MTSAIELRRLHHRPQEATGLDLDELAEIVLAGALRAWPIGSSGRHRDRPLPDSQD
jgi:hypothetical protein